MSHHSPTPSIDSADDALFEMLGIDQFSWNDNDEVVDAISEENNGVNGGMSSSLCSSDYDHLSDDCSQNNNDNNNKYDKLDPPRHCHRPNTSHSPILLVSSKSLLTTSQCNYIINFGYKASNNGGKTHGPQYITEAAHSSHDHHGDFSSASSYYSSSTNNASSSSSRVKLDNPNHHKVCVFTNDVILTWIQDAFKVSRIDDAIRDWSRENGYYYDHEEYSITINPRLRLLRYDARDDDDFLPHYDATTTTTTTMTDKNNNNNDENSTTTTTTMIKKESKITILLYLNTGNEIDFQGGNTIFLNSLESNNKKDYLKIIPECGKFVIFNHELYHASEKLRYVDSIIIPSYNSIGMKQQQQQQQSQNNNKNNDEKTIQGGSKFVLRTDIMFHHNANKRQYHESERSTYINDDDIITYHNNYDGNNNNKENMIKVNDVISDLLYNDNDDDDENEKGIIEEELVLSLTNILKELDLYFLSVKSFLVPGTDVIKSILLDLGLQQSIVDSFCKKCQDAIS